MHSESPEYRLGVEREVQCILPTSHEPQMGHLEDGLGRLGGHW